MSCICNIQPQSVDGFYISTWDYNMQKKKSALSQYFWRALYFGFHMGLDRTCSTEVLRQYYNYEYCLDVIVVKVMYHDWDVSEILFIPLHSQEV